MFSIMKTNCETELLPEFLHFQLLHCEISLEFMSIVGETEMHKWYRSYVSDTLPSMLMFLKKLKKKKEAICQLVACT